MAMDFRGALRELNRCTMRYSDLGNNYRSVLNLGTFVYGLMMGEDKEKKYSRPFTVPCVASS